MNWVFLHIKESSFLSPTQRQPFYLPQSPPTSSPQNLRSNSFDLSSKISPSVLLIIIILAIIFFISGLLHLLVRFLLRPNIRETDDPDDVTALQGQLQQLFHLHDAGVDQSYIDTLPVFHYKTIIGLKNYPFDCAVCLCEFEPEDKLRLLPKCSHAFHMECIDTWLLSHSTCPLCRATLLPDFSPNNTCSPIVLVLESGSESSREIVTDNTSANAAGIGRTSSVLRNNSCLGFHANNDFGSTRFDFGHKSCEIARKDDFRPDRPDPDAGLVVESGEKVVPVKLGKFKNIDGGCGESSSSSSTSSKINNSSNVNARRCFSMGSFEYVMDEESFLQVPVTIKNNSQPGKKKPLLPLGHRPARSVCDCESRREFKFSGFSESSRIVEETKGNSIGKNQKESFSISKIWLRGKREKQNTLEEGGPSGRRAFSFRFPVNQSNNAAAIANVDVKEKNVSGESCCDEEGQRCNGLESLQAKTPSFARKTLLWLVGKQNKVVHSSFAPDV